LNKRLELSKSLEKKKGKKRKEKEKKYLKRTGDVN
jgi:hypothetical protein